MATLRLIAKAFAALVAAVLYLWYGAVRFAPEAGRRRRARHGH